MIMSLLSDFSWYMLKLVWAFQFIQIALFLFSLHDKTKFHISQQFLLILIMIANHVNFSKVMSKIAFLNIKKLMLEVLKLHRTTLSLKISFINMVSYWLQRLLVLRDISLGWGRTIMKDKSEGLELYRIILNLKVSDEKALGCLAWTGKEESLDEWKANHKLQGRRTGFDYVLTQARKFFFEWKIKKSISLLLHPIKEIVRKKSRTWRALSFEFVWIYIYLLEHLTVWNFVWINNF